MTKKLNYAVYYLLAFLFSVICVFGTSAFFISSNALAPVAAKVLKLKITPAYIGGNIAQTFSIKEYESVLKSYTVHEPVFGGKPPMQEYWQLDLTFGKSQNLEKGFTLKLNMGYETFLLTRKSSSSTNDEFIPVYDSRKNKICTAMIVFSQAHKTCYIKIPLKDKTMRKIYTVRKSSHSIQIDGEEKIFEKVIF